ncbi:ZIP Zinc transporter [Shewanella psychrophila]|uniref:ZIP Zinc transporter n=1 Tax=Shewanella psychrophila TaxID=225848 RepID=A0A1S6HJP4_9GAMM|nr:hypothetical protein [Shewanella psychrophila]AQS35745.1 ZIP Zinc transporter [Shewanella psychrophila]
MIYLFVSCVSLLAGPIFYRFLNSDHGLRKGLDGFIFITISGLVILHILPDLVKVGGAIAVITVLVGLILPTMAEKFFKGDFGTTQKIAIVLSLFGLMLHNITDGCSIILAQQADASIMLAVGVIIHRLPEGLAIWWMVQPRSGSLWASAALLLMLGMTCLGYFAGGELLIHLNLESTVYLQAFVAGSIMHVILHQHVEGECCKKDMPERIGALIGFAILYMLVNGIGHVHHH